MTLIDSSSWIHALRKTGNEEVRKRVFQLIVDGDAAWCDVVRLELRQGAVHPKEHVFLRELEADLPSMPMTPTVWDAACDLAVALRHAGQTVPLTDVMIFACAKTHGLDLEHQDKHFLTLSAVQR
jgi:predicted nucleic acid-binding protein